ncbi:hypothetical protein TGAM01_v210930 [Trichoderma gamsii]|uniref:TM7S3/TM198-like domain-containing protein n=1 Tax=Trichoderma gamsii TaxID=398673 RepID=A0A2P4Z7E0_9HYPO|nr:hypothetical protein TGAM01_v210930 [Trichoderma gamsii]PON20209.1 hypothetical protein TGAM01_v210930 [Trichoderma gamsii]
MLRIVRPQALLCLLLILQLAATQEFRELRRPDNSISSSTVFLCRPEPGSQHSFTSESNGDHKQTDGPRGLTITKASETTTSVTAEIQTTTTVTTSDSPLNTSTSFKASIPAGDLPIQPIITPGWGVAGNILMLTGLVYTLVGNKSRWINCFFSTAFIAALGISVLIIYTMNVPVSLGMQGAYVVVAVLSGCALGAASLISKVSTEGLGCALGGFSLSMWFLCLALGGLLRDTIGRAIFIFCFPVLGFAFYISHYTRYWATIILTSFGGATVIVLGIDCYSRVGLKEFWAYVWNLSDNLFPLGTDTYFITRGMEVEIAAIVIICLIGIISEIKPWKVVRKKRGKKAANLLDSLRYLAEKEDDAGRNVEAQAAGERDERGKAYGGRAPFDSNGTVANHSDAIGGGSNSKSLFGEQSESAFTGSKIDGIQMIDFSDSNLVQTGMAGLIHADMAKDGKVMVRVTAYGVNKTPKDSEGEATDEKVGAIPNLMTISLDGDRPTSHRIVVKGKQISQASSKLRWSSSHRTITAAAEVVLPPFKIPTEDDLKSVCGLSSVATFFHDEAIAPATFPRDFLAKRVPQSSVALLRRLSPQKLKHVSSEHQMKSDENSEGLAELAAITYDDYGSSLAATIDYDSTSDDEAHNSIVGAEHPNSIEITAQLSQVKKAQGSKQLKSDTIFESNVGKSDDATFQDVKQAMAAKSNAELSQIKSQPSDMHDTQEAHKGNSETKLGDTAQDEETPMPLDQESTTASNEVESKPLEPGETARSCSSATLNLVGLTKDRLPESLSKLALSYRRDEWTEHLSHADTPEPEAISIEPYASEQDVEDPLYIDVEDLLKAAAGDIIRPSAVKRSEVRMNQVSFVQPNSKGIKKKHNLFNVTISAAVSPTVMSSSRSPVSLPIATAIQPASVFMDRISSKLAPIVEEQDGVRLAGIPAPEEVMERDRVQMNSARFRPIMPRIVSFENPHTLLGQRGSVLWSRPQGNLISHVSKIPSTTQGSVGNVNSLRNYSVYNRVLSLDPDNSLPSRRKKMLRQSSVASLPLSNSRPNRSISGVEVAANTQFNSHQPKRVSSVSVVAQETRLAKFRQSIAHANRSMTLCVPNMGDDAPFASTATLIDDINAQRAVMIEKKEAEMQRREMQRREKQWYDRMCESRMRSGELLGAHRQAIRKMQSSARDV